MENHYLPFSGVQFSETWAEWLQFRKENRFKKYVPTGLKKTFTMLKNISGDNEKIAILILNQSMEQGWQGLFPLKQVSNGSSKTTSTLGGKSGGFGRISEAQRQFSGTG